MPQPSPGSCPWLPDGRSRRGRRSGESLIPISSHRRRRGPGIGAIFDRVMRPRPSPLERSRRRDGHLYGGTQPTDLSMIDRRCYRPRLFRWLELPRTPRMVTYPPARLPRLDDAARAASRIDAAGGGAIYLSPKSRPRLRPPRNRAPSPCHRRVLDSGSHINARLHLLPKAGTQRTL
jgi:hypothetical protein